MKVPASKDRHLPTKPHGKACDRCRHAQLGHLCIPCEIIGSHSNLQIAYFARLHVSDIAGHAGQNTAAFAACSAGRSTCMRSICLGRCPRTCHGAAPATRAVHGPCSARTHHGHDPRRHGMPRELGPQSACAPQRGQYDCHTQQAQKENSSRHHQKEANGPARDCQCKIVQNITFRVCRERSLLSCP